MSSKLTYTINSLKDDTGWGRTKIYEFGAQGRLDFRKLDGRTIITGQSVRRLIRTLPPAKITTGRKRALGRKQRLQPEN